MHKRKLKKRISRSKGYLATGIITAMILSFLIIAMDFYQTRKTVFISPIPKSGYEYKSDKTKELKNSLEKYNIPFSDIFLASDSSFIVNLQNGEKVLFSSSKPTEHQLSSLQLILSRFTIEGKRFAFLDFRFDEPIVGLR